MRGSAGMRPGNPRPGRPRSRSALHHGPGSSSSGPYPCPHDRPAALVCGLPGHLSRTRLPGVVRRRRLLEAPRSGDPPRRTARPLFQGRARGTPVGGVERTRAGHSGRIRCNSNGETLHAAPHRREAQAHRWIGSVGPLTPLIAAANRHRTFRVRIARARARCGSPIAQRQQPTARGSASFLRWNSHPGQRGHITAPASPPAGALPVTAPPGALWPRVRFASGMSLRRDRSTGPGAVIQGGRPCEGSAAASRHGCDFSDISNKGLPVNAIRASRRRFLRLSCEK